MGRSLFSWWRRYEHSLVWALLLVGVAIRWLNLNPLLPFTYDQGRDLLALQSIAAGDITLIGPTTGIAGFFLGPFYYYFLLPGFFLGQGDPFVVGAWNALWITAGLTLTYYVLKQVVSPGLALLTYVWLLFVPGALEAARIIWNPSLTALTMAGMLGGLFWSVKESSRYRWAWLGLGLFSFGLGLQTEFAYVIFFVPLLLWWLWRFWDGQLPLGIQLFKKRSTLQLASHPDRRVDWSQYLTAASSVRGSKSVFDDSVFTT